MLLSLSLLVLSLGTEQIHPGALLRHGIQDVTPNHPQDLGWEPGHAHTERLRGSASQTGCAQRSPRGAGWMQAWAQGRGSAFPAGIQVMLSSWSLVYFRLAGFWVSESYPRLRIIALVDTVSCVGFCKYGDNHLRGHRGSELRGRRSGWGWAIGAKLAECFKKHRDWQADLSASERAPGGRALRKAGWGRFHPWQIPHARPSEGPID